MSDNEHLGTKLEDFGTKLSHLARHKKLPPVFGRERELELLEKRLADKGNRSLIFIGPSGVGKTALLYGLAQRICADSGGWEILETTTTRLMAGTRYLGEWQTRIQKLLDLCRGKRTIVYLKDVEMLPTEGSSSNSPSNIGGFIAPAVDRGELIVFGEASEEAFRLRLEPHPAVRNLFTVLRLREPGPDALAALLLEAADARAQRVSKDTRVELHVPQSVVGRLPELAGPFFPDRAEPGKSLGLLDAALRHEAGVARDDERDFAEITDQALVTALSRETGMPTLMLDDTEPLDPQAVRSFFEARVIGQGRAIKVVTDLITLVKAGVNDPTKPLGVLFFVGPTGVGKTELAKALAEFLFGSAERMVRLDMSEYKDYHGFEKLIGNPQASLAHLQEGTLTGAVRQNPFSVVLLDEFEKAHPNIFDLFLQVFDDGRLTDTRGRTTSFTQTIIVMTSNVGAQAIADTPIGFGSMSPEAADADLRKRFLKEMERAFRPEFLGRIDHVVPFSSLDEASMRVLARRELGRVLLRSGIVRRRLRVDVDESLFDLLIEKGFNPKLGARPLKRAVESLVLLPIARQLVSMAPGESQAPLLRLRVADGGVSATLVRSRRTVQLEAQAAAADKRAEASAEAVAEAVSELRGRLDALKDRLAAMKTAKAELMARMGAHDFWDDPEAASRVLHEVHLLERTISRATAADTRLEDLAAFAERARRTPQPALMAKLGARLAEVQTHVEQVILALRFDEEPDRLDAFVELRLLDSTAGPDGADPVHELGAMYEAWAARHGFSVHVVHEATERAEGAPEGLLTRALTLLVEGVATFGQLRGESGLHEWVYGRVKGADKEVRYVRVKVIPQPLSEPRALTSTEVKRKVDKVVRDPGGRRTAAGKRRRVSVTHRQSKASVEGISDLPEEELGPLLEDLLRMRLAGDALAGATSEPDAPLRRYTTRSKRTVRALPDGAPLSLDEVLAGGLDALLAASD